MNWYKYIFNNHNCIPTITIIPVEPGAVFILKLFIVRGGGLRTYKRQQQQQLQQQQKPTAATA